MAEEDILLSDNSTIPVLSVGEDIENELLGIEAGEYNFGRISTGHMNQATRQISADLPINEYAIENDVVNEFENEDQPESSSHASERSERRRSGERSNRFGNERVIESVGSFATSVSGKSNSPAPSNPNPRSNANANASVSSPNRQYRQPNPHQHPRMNSNRFSNRPPMRPAGFRQQRPFRQSFEPRFSQMPMQMQMQMQRPMQMQMQMQMPMPMMQNGLGPSPDMYGDPNSFVSQQQLNMMPEHNQNVAEYGPSRFRQPIPARPSYPHNRPHAPFMEQQHPQPQLLQHQQQQHQFLRPGPNPQPPRPQQHQLPHHLQAQNQHFANIMPNNQNQSNCQNVPFGNVMPHQAPPHQQQSFVNPGANRMFTNAVQNSSQSFNVAFDNESISQPPSQPQILMMNNALNHSQGQGQSMSGAPVTFLSNANQLMSMPHGSSSNSNLEQQAQLMTVGGPTQQLVLDGQGRLMTLSSAVVQPSAVNGTPVCMFVNPSFLNMGSTSSLSNTNSAVNVGVGMPVPAVTNLTISSIQLSDGLVGSTPSGNVASTPASAPAKASMPPQTLLVTPSNTIALPTLHVPSHGVVLEHAQAQPKLQTQPQAQPQQQQQSQPKQPHQQQAQTQAQPKPKAQVQNIPVHSRLGPATSASASANDTQQHVLSQRIATIVNEINRKVPNNEVELHVPKRETAVDLPEGRANVSGTAKTTSNATRNPAPVSDATTTSNQQKPEMETDDAYRRQLAEQKAARERIRKLKEQRRAMRTAGEDDANSLLNVVATLSDSGTVIDTTTSGAKREFLGTTAVNNDQEPEPQPAQKVPRRSGSLLAVRHLPKSIKQITLEKLCSTFGNCEYVRFDPLRSSALIKFRDEATAQRFADKYEKYVYI